MDSEIATDLREKSNEDFNKENAVLLNEQSVARRALDEAKTEKMNLESQITVLEELKITTAG